MTTIPHEPVVNASRRPWTDLLTMTQVWATLAIVAIWLAVLFSALFAPDIVTHSYLGDHVTVPSGVAIALFAACATWPIAWFGFKGRK